MSKIQLLDCTLRDGGYINNFRFGKYAIRKILQQLTHAGLDIVECGFWRMVNTTRIPPF